MVNLSDTAHGTGNRSNLGLNGLSSGNFLQLTGKAMIRTDQPLSVFSLPANYSEKNSTFSKKALAPPDVPLVFI